ncbi:alpha/beta fold hydrolase [Nocardia asteroides]
MSHDHDLNEALDHFQPKPFFLVGHSAGGPIVRLAAAPTGSRAS